MHEASGLDLRHSDGPKDAIFQRFFGASENDARAASVSIGATLHCIACIVKILYALISILVGQRILVTWSHVYVLSPR